MKKVESTKYSDFFFDEQQNLFFVFRKKNTKKMSNEEYKLNTLLWAQLLIKYKPQKQIVDDRNMDFIITPELQDWANKKLIAPGIKAGIKKVAFVESDDTFVKVAIEQTMDDNSLEIEVSYFEHMENAKKWLEVDF